MQSKGLVLVLGTIALLVGCGTQPQAVNSPVASPPVTSPTPQETPPPPSPTIAASPSPSPSPTSTTSTVVKQLEGRLTDEFSQKAGVTLQSLSCPNQDEMKVGDRLECEAVAEGQNFTIAAEITNPEGPQFTWSTRRLVVLSKVETEIQDQVKAKKGGEVTATCNGKIRAANQGERFDCQVSNTQGQSRSVRVTVKDDQGSVDITLL